MTARLRARKSQSTSQTIAIELLASATTLAARYAPYTARIIFSFGVAVSLVIASCRGKAVPWEPLIRAAGPLFNHARPSRASHGQRPVVPADTARGHRLRAPPAAGR